MKDVLYREVPKEFWANVDFRGRVLALCREDAGYRDSMMRACSESLLFWVNTFAWLYEPREWKTPAGEPMPLGTIPFVSYEFQDDAMTVLNDCIGREDVVLNKSRDMGASYMILTVFLWRWLFATQMNSFLLVSRNADFVDCKGNPKSLFAKMDRILLWLPGWMLPSYSRVNMHMENAHSGSVIDGESTTGQIARGDRRTAIMLDEFAAFDINDGYKAEAATRDATKCRIFNSTPQGTNNAFHDRWLNPDTRKLALHWTLHPTKSLGMYMEGGKPRSPWYDNECKRASHDQEVAAELDMSFLGSSFAFFEHDKVDEYIYEVTRPPYRRGEIHTDPETFRMTDWEENEEGRFKLWFHPDAEGNPPPERHYAIALDVSQGTGSSNSVIVVGDKTTKEKVAEFVSAKTQPWELARIAYAMAHWFSYRAGGSAIDPAFIIWEANGPGGAFGSSLTRDLGFSRVYYRRREETSSRKVTDTPGFWTDTKSKRTLLGSYKVALLERHYLNRSKPSLEETKEYVYESSGDIVHTRSKRAIDPSAARASHGDSVIADALLWHVMKEVSAPKPKAVVAPHCSFLGRRERATRSRESNAGW